MATAAIAAPAPNPHPLRNRHFRLLWAGGTISLLGDQFYLVTLPWVVLQLTGSAIAMGTVLMAGAIPRAVLMLMGGAVSDRFSPRRVMMATGAVRAMAVTGIGALLAVHGIHLWHIYLLTFAFGVADAFAMPAAQALLPTLVEADQLPAANALRATTGQLTTVLGPAPAAWLMKLLGAAAAFFIDAVSFLFVIGALWALPDPPRSAAPARRQGMLHSIVEGMRYLGSDASLRSLMLLATVLNFCMAGPFTVGLAYLARQRFASPTAYGIWVSALSAGSLLGMALAGVRKLRMRGPLFLLLCTALGLTTAAFGLVEGLWPAAALLLAMGATAGFVNVQLQTWYQQRIERSMMGRVMSVLMFAAFGLMPISLAAAGFAITWSMRGMFAIAGAGVLVVVAFAATQKPVRQIGQ